MRSAATHVRWEMRKVNKGTKIVFPFVRVYRNPHVNKYV